MSHTQAHRKLMETNRIKPVVDMTRKLLSGASVLSIFALSAASNGSMVTSNVVYSDEATSTEVILEPGETLSISYMGGETGEFDWSPSTAEADQTEDGDVETEWWTERDLSFHIVAQAAEHEVEFDYYTQLEVDLITPQGEPVHPHATEVRVRPFDEILHVTVPYGQEVTADESLDTLADDEHDVDDVETSNPQADAANTASLVDELPQSRYHRARGWTSTHAAFDTGAAFGLGVTLQVKNSQSFAVRIRVDSMARAIFTGTGDIPNDESASIHVAEADEKISLPIPTIEDDDEDGEGESDVEGDSDA